MKKYVISLIFASITLYASDKVTFSEMGNTSCSVSFEKLVIDGLESHPSIQMSKETIKGASFEVDTAKWGYYPSPSVDYSMKSTDKERLVVRLEQPIWTGGKLDSAHKQAKAKEQQAKYELDENRYKLIDNYVLALKEYLKTQDKIKALNFNKKQYYDLSEMLDRFMEAGELSQTDKNLLNSRIAALSSDLIITKAQYKVSLIQLEILTGRKINCQIGFEPKSALSLQIDADRLVEELQTFHPSLKMMDAKIQAAVAEVDSAKAKLWPSLVLRGEHVRGTIYDDDTDPENENLVYLNLNISTGAGLSGLSNIDKAKVAISRTKFEKSTKQKELLDELMADYTNYISAMSQLQVVEEDIKTAELIYESNQRLFTSQKKSWLDLVNSLSELSKQRIKYVELLVDRDVLEYKIALKTGRVNLQTLEVASGI